MAYEVFISYSHQDQTLRQKLDNHLSNLRQQNIITSWYDGEITAGTNWRSQIMQHLNNAQIILLLISDDFMASEFCYSIEMTQAITRHDANQARHSDHPPPRWLARSTIRKNSGSAHGRQAYDRLAQPG